MFVPLLLLVFGILGVTRGEFKITKSRQVYGPIALMLGILMLGGFGLSFVESLFGPLALGLAIMVGFATSQKIGAEPEKPSARKIFLSIGLGLGIPTIVVAGPIVILALFGPIIGQAYEMAQSPGTPPTAVVARPTRQVLVSMPANEINLQTSDLTDFFSLNSEDTQENFVGNRISDGNQRLFVSRELALQSRVLVYDDYPQVYLADLMEQVRQGVMQEFEGETVTFEPTVVVSIGALSGYQKFSTQEAEGHGYVLVFIKRNVLARLLFYGRDENLNVADLQALAQIIEARIK